MQREKPISQSLDNLAGDGGLACAEGASTWGRVGDYERLTGGEGRGVHFRPERYRRASWTPIAISVRAGVDAETVHGPAIDVSQNGVAFLWPDRVPVNVGQALSDLVVTFDGREAYRGAARVASVRPGNNLGADAADTSAGAARIVGVALSSGVIDIGSWLQVRSVQAWASDALRIPDATAGVAARADWRVAGHERFKAGVASLRLLLEDIEQMMAGLDDSLSPPSGRGDRAALVSDAIQEQVRSHVAPAVVALSGEVDHALRGVTSPAERAALGAFSRRYLHEILMRAPWMHRARHKPLGYPGDFGVMAYLYNAPFSGPTLFVRAVSLAFSCTPAGEAVRTRKDLIKRQLSAFLDRPSDRPVRILSIASGPATEIVELLDQRPPPAAPIEIVLFDQDQRALAHASAEIGRATRWKGRLEVSYLHDAIKPLLRGGGALVGQGTFDAIYACGLLDYLRTRTAVTLCRTLYGMLAPGGTLYVGNMVPSNPSRWIMELHLDWYLIYREIEQLLQIGRTAAPAANLQLLEESTGVNPFVALRREQ